MGGGKYIRAWDIPENSKKKDSCAHVLRIVRNVLVKTGARAMEAREGGELKCDMMGNRDLLKISEWRSAMMICAS